MAKNPQAQTQANEHGAARRAGGESEVANPGGETPYQRWGRAFGRALEIAVARWRPGRRCAPHDHGGAGGLVVLLRGRYRERVFRSEGGVLRLTSVRSYQAPAILRVEADTIHDMVAYEGGLSLHFYWPAPRAIAIFDQVAEDTATVAGTGAWRPVSPVQEIGRATRREP